MRYLAILAALALAGCSIGNVKLGANKFKGQPTSAVFARLGSPDYQETFGGQKAYTWRMGTPMLECKIQVIATGDVIDSYEASGDARICESYPG